MLPKEERRAMLLRLFNDSTPLVHMKRDKGDEVKHERKNSSSPDLDIKTGEPDAKDKKMDDDAIGGGIDAEEVNGVTANVKAENGANELDMEDLEAVTAGHEAVRKDEEIAALEDEAGKEVEPNLQVGDEEDVFNKTV